jgi:hypothetical protein
VRARNCNIAAGLFTGQFLHCKDFGPSTMGSTTMADWAAKLRAVRVHGQDWAPGLVTAMILGFAVVGFYGWRSGDAGKFVAALLLSGACLLVGVFLGFLFGIPRSLQAEGPPLIDQNQSAEMKQEVQKLRIQYRANTNLEQISDWLTKILVGVGLTQLVAIPDLSTRVGSYFGGAIGQPEGASQIAISIIILFSVCGFLFGYLWTRLFLGGELARADLNAVTEQVREVVEEQGLIDAKAIGLANQFLSATDPSKISLDALKGAIEKASPPVKVQLFYQAREARSRSWQRKKTNGC